MADKKATLIKQLSNFSFKELCDIENEITRIKKIKHKAEAKDLAEKLKALIQKSGISTNDVLPILAPKNKNSRSKLKPKYQNPENLDQTWSGRGKTPKWAKSYKDQNKLDEIEIKENS